MPKTKSGKKRLAQNEKRRIRNKKVKSETRTVIKSTLATFEGEGDNEKALVEAYSMLDRAAKKGVIHPRQAARRKARLAKRLNKLNASA